jgi:DNA-binding NarL/FixJ family response regulator
MVLATAAPCSIASFRSDRQPRGGLCIGSRGANLANRANRKPGGADSLTSREAKVMALVAEGRTNAAIAGALVIGEQAVEKHAVLRYLGVN